MTVAESGAGLEGWGSASREIDAPNLSAEFQVFTKLPLRLALECADNAQPIDRINKNTREAERLRGCEEKITGN